MAEPSLHGSIHSVFWKWLFLCIASQKSEKPEPLTELRSKLLNQAFSTSIRPVISMCRA